MVNIGVLGSGWVVGWHIFGVQHNGNVRVKALASRNMETGSEAASRFGAKYYQTYHEMYDKEELDGIINLLPNHLHYESCCDAIDAGIRHILCEKPLGNDLALSEKLVEKAEATGTMLQAGYMKRFNPAFQKAKKALGEIGPVQFAGFFTAETGAENEVSHRDKSSSWKTDAALSGGGNLTHVGSHDIDFIRYLFGDVKAVSCRLRRDAADLPEFYANGRLFMENGVEADLKIGRVDVPDLGPNWGVFKGGWNETLEIVGDKGYIQVANPSWEGLAAARVASWFHGQPGPSVEYCRSDLQWVEEIADFARGIETGKPSGVATTARDGYKVDLIVRCMRKSDEMGGAAVQIDKKAL